MIAIQFTSRQNKIIDLVKEHQPITSEQLAEKLNITRAALRADLSILTMSDVLEARPKVGYFYKGKKITNISYEHIRNIKVKDIKSNTVVVSEDTVLYDAVVSLFLKDAGTLYVQNDGALTGVVSRKDIIKVIIGNKDMQNMPVGMIMTRMPNIIYVTDEDTAFDAAEKIISHAVDSIPVVELAKDEDNKEILKITGKISKTNITKLFYNIFK